MRLHPPMQQVQRLRPETGPAQGGRYSSLQLCRQICTRQLASKSTSGNFKL